MTPKQKECLDAIRDLTVDGVSPSYDEIKDRLGLASKGTVHALIQALMKDGWIVASPYRRRTLRLAPQTIIQGLKRDELIDLRRQINRRLAA